MAKAQRKKGTSKDTSIVPLDHVERHILLIRGEKVLLGQDLARLYDVEPRSLIQAVKRNIERFPRDFMFQLTREETANLKSHSVTSSWGGARRATPYAFTEQGVAMLSSVLRSERAVQVNVAIMRTFVRLRQMLSSNATLSKRLDELEKTYDEQFAAVFEAIRQLMDGDQEEKARPPIGYQTEEKHFGRATSKR